MKRYSLVMVTLFLLIGQLFFTANVDAATSNSVATQGGGHICGVDGGIMIDDKLRTELSAADSRSRDIETFIPAGTYAITMTSYDNHSDHIDAPSKGVWPFAA